MRVQKTSLPYTGKRGETSFQELNVADQAIVRHLACELSKPRNDYFIEVSYSPEKDPDWVANNQDLLFIQPRSKNDHFLYLKTTTQYDQLPSSTRAQLENEITKRTTILAASNGKKFHETLEEGYQDTLKGYKYGDLSPLIIT